MSDLIDRQAAIDALAKVARDNFNLSDEFEFYLKGLTDAEDAIYGLPSAEPKRKTGHWVKRTRIYESGTCTSYDPEWFCSECRTKYDPYFAINRVKFCYVCGADMRGGQSDT